MSDDVCMYVCTHYQIMCKKKDNGDITHYIRTHIEFVYYHSSNVVRLVELYEKRRICVYVFKVVQGITITALPSRVKEEKKKLIIAVR